MLLPIVLARHTWRSKILSTMPRAMLISLFYSAFFIGLFEALNTTTALNTGTLFTLVPLITALISIVAFRERISAKQCFVYLLGIAGTTWVIFKGQLDLLLSFTLNSGDLIFLFAILSMSIYTIAMKLLYRNDDMIVLVFCTLAGGSFWMALALILTDQPLQWHLIQGHSIGHMLYLIIGATLATVYLYQVTTVALGPARVNAYIYINPALIALLFLIFDGTSISNAVIPGIVISFFATLVLQSKKTKISKIFDTNEHY